jgi:hypothetical protein
MRHPRSIAERRQNRRTIMVRRRQTILRWYEPDSTLKPEDNPAWHRCDKWNLNCGSMFCHAGKYFSARRQRREGLKRDISGNVASWADSHPLLGDQLHSSSKTDEAFETTH